METPKTTDTPLARVLADLRASGLSLVLLSLGVLALTGAAVGAVIVR